MEDYTLVSSNTYHLAIIDAATLERIIRGEKTIESRLSRVRCLPHGRIVAGDVLYFKIAGGLVRAVARVARVHSETDLTPERVQALATQYSAELAWPAGWLEQHLKSRYCTLIWLADVQPFGPHLFPKKSRAAWVLLPGPLHGADERGS